MICAITLNHYLIVSGLLFALGIAGVIIRRNALVIFMALEKVGDVDHDAGHQGLRLIKKIKAGEPVGYGCADVSENDRIIAILPVGYADGLSRQLGNSIGSLWIKGSRVPIIGNICMDMCMVDITGLNVEPGDEAEIFGENISIDEVAKKCQTIPYEILTSIPRRVKRVFFRD